MWAFAIVVAALFVSGAVWRATHPNASENPTEEKDIATQQDGYYLCLHRPQLTAAQMYRLVQQKLPHDNRTIALRGCEAGQKR